MVERGIGMGWSEGKDREEKTLEQQISYRKQNWQSYDDLFEEAQVQIDQHSKKVDQETQNAEDTVQTADEWRNGFVVRADGTTLWARE